MTPNEQPRVLIVEDDDDARELISELLHTQGMSVAEASDGERALEMLVDDRPDVVVLDWRMSGLDGRGTLDAIRNNPSTTTLPVIVMTALKLRREEVSGASAVLLKPFDIDEICALLRRFAPGHTDPG